MKPKPPPRIIIIASILLTLTFVTVFANRLSLGFGFSKVNALPTSNAADSYTLTTLLVTKVDDTNDGVCDADCSLREAVAAANALAGEDIIQFDPTVFGSPQTILLSNGSLQPTGSSMTTINGPGARLLTNRRLYPMETLVILWQRQSHLRLLQFRA